MKNKLFEVHKYKHKLRVSDNTEVTTLQCFGSCDNEMVNMAEMFYL